MIKYKKGTPTTNPKKQIKQKEDAEIYNNDPRTSATVNRPQKTPDYQYKDYWSKHLHTVVMLACTTHLSLAGIIWIAYCVYALIKRYRLYKNVEAVINLVDSANPTVGKTLTCTICFKGKDGRKYPHRSATFHELEESIVIQPQPCNDDVKRVIAVLQEVDKRNNHISGKFSVRKCGTYQITVKYYMFHLTQASERPFTFEVLPGPVCPKYMDFATHNPHTLCLIAGLEQYFKLRMEDEYGNKCGAENVDLKNLSFKLFHMGNTLPVKHDFCLSHPNNNSENETETCNNERPAADVCLKIKLSQPGIFSCILKYGDCEVRGNHGAPKLMVCLSPNEDTELRNLLLFSKIKMPGTLIYSTKCKLCFVGDEDGYKDFYAGMSANWLVFAKYEIPLRLYPDASFPINGRARITHQANQTSSSEAESLILLVQDGIRRTIRLEMESSAGRIFLILFAHNQGYLFPKTRVSFQDKKSELKCQLYSYLSWLSSDKMLCIEHDNFIKSTQKEIPRHPDDWLLPFKIKYDGGPASAVVGTQEWINRLCEEFFKKEQGMFQRLQGSKLLHPVSSNISHEPLENYRLAGQILAKAVVETLLRGICTHLSQVRFTRSLLTFILGFPISFKYLESDEPRFFRKIIEIADQDLVGKEYSFTTLPSSTSDTNIVNLIPNGSSIPVTNTNKEHYLNLLTHYRLIHTVEQEITAFRTGFHDVIDKDKLSYFQEDDLQKLISGGCKFSITDLKANHRVVKEVDNGFLGTVRRQSMDTKKLLNWFWTAIENMSEEEQSYLLFFATGSFSLPSCGLADLNPLFTISLTGTLNQPPKANPASNEIVLADHACFESFERSLLYAITPESERIVLPGAEIICAQRGFCGNNVDLPEEMEVNDDEGLEDTQFYGRTRETSGEDPFLNWLRELINL